MNIMLALIMFSQSIIIDVMELVDYIGESTGIAVIEQIDALNEAWYSLEDLKDTMK